MRPSPHLAAFRFPRAAGKRGPRQHAIFRCHPSPSTVFQPAGHAGLDRGVTQHPGMADLDQHRALGHRSVMRREAHGAHCVGSPIMGAEECRRGLLLGVHFLIVREPGSCSRFGTVPKRNYPPKVWTRMKLPIPPRCCPPVLEPSAYQSRSRGSPLPSLQLIVTRPLTPLLPSSSSLSQDVL